MSQHDAAEALAQHLLAEEEQAKAKAAAKKAKKQKQKASKSQPASPDTSGSTASVSTSPGKQPMLQPGSTPLPGSRRSGSTLYSNKGNSASADAATRCSVEPEADKLQAELHQLSINASSEEEVFLEQLFRCPLSQVYSCLVLYGIPTIQLLYASLPISCQHAPP